MPNYRYKLLEKDYVLSQEEHEIVTESIKNKETSVFLRNGTLMINMNFVAAISTTDDLTDIEMENKTNILALKEGDIPLKKIREKGRSFLAKTHEDFYKKMGWDK